MSLPTPAKSDHRFRIAAFPAGVTRQGNPYFALCHAALAKHGISVSDDLEVDLQWLNARAGSVDAVHFHWPELFWRRGSFGSLSRFERAAQACRRLLQLKRFVRAARTLGMLRIWTFHNLEPHEGAFRWDRYGYRLIARESDIVICHSHSATVAVRHAYHPRGRIVVMPIGELSAAHPAPRPRAEVLEGLGLDPGLPFLSCLGRLRDYKGLDVACNAVARLQGRVQLMIGGPPHAGFDVSSLVTLVERTPGAVLIARRLTDQEFADVMAASDAVLLPYRAITGSSALLAAIGFGRGVVASELPYFQEILAPEPAAGVTVRGWDPEIWAQTILEFLDRPAALRNGAAVRLATRYSWERCVEPLVAALGVHEDMASARMRTAGAPC